MFLSPTKLMWIWVGLLPNSKSNNIKNKNKFYFYTTLTNTLNW